MPCKKETHSRCINMTGRKSTRDSTEKRLYITLDFEEDGGSAAQNSTFFCHAITPAFIEHIVTNHLRATIFVTGEILAKRPDLLQPYLEHDTHFQFESHGYDHRVIYKTASDRCRNVERGIDAYEKFFGRKPLIYRAPDGVISDKEIMLLLNRGIRYSSSIFPSYFPGRFNNLHLPRSPFRIKEGFLTEIPFTVTQLLRLPVALSYMQLIGLWAFRLLLLHRPSKTIVFDMHLHDLHPQVWFKKARPPLSSQIMYGKNNCSDSFGIFRKAINFFIEKGYANGLLEEFAEDLDKEKLPEYPAYEVYGK